MSWTSTNWKLLDGSNFSLPYPSALTQIIDTIDNSNIKFCFYKYGVENYGLPKSIPFNIDIPGACKGLSNLTSVTIPQSVKYIDHYAFYQTGLSSVTIANDCVYQSTSFPSGCVINRYPSE